MLSCLILLYLHLLHLTLEQVVLLLELTVLATEGVFQLFQSFTLLLILALPKLFLTSDALYLGLGLIEDLLLSRLQFVIKAALCIFAGLLHFFNLAVQELDLLGEQGLFAA